MTQQARETRGRGSGRMGARSVSWLAWSVWALSLPLTAFSGVLAFLSASSRTWDAAFLLFFFPLMSLMFATVGAVVASQRPENPIGWIFCTGGLLLSATISASAYSTYALYKRPGQLPGVDYATWLAGWAPLPTLLLTATLLFLLFPNGRVISPEWRFVAGVAVLGCVMAALGEALGREHTAVTDYNLKVPNPVAIGGAVGDFLLTLVGFGTLLLVMSALASITSLFARWVWAQGQERQQLKWFAYAAVVMIGGFLLAFTVGSSWGLVWDLGMVVGIVGFAFLPLATAIAVLRYRLYDIDRIINRTLVYGSLTALLALVYFGGVTVTQAISESLTGQEEQPQLVIVISTLAIAAIFSPLRRRVQSFVDRRFYRRKYDAAKTLAALNARLRDETELETLSGEVVGVVRETVQPAHVSVWLRSSTEMRGSRESP